MRAAPAPLEISEDGTASLNASGSVVGEDECIELEQPVAGCRGPLVGPPRTSSPGVAGPETPRSRSTRSKRTSPPLLDSGECDQLFGLLPDGDSSGQSGCLQRPSTKATGKLGVGSSTPVSSPRKNFASRAYSQLDSPRGRTPFSLGSSATQSPREGAPPREVVAPPDCRLVRSIRPPQSAW